MAQAGLKLTILLPQPLKCWNYTYEPPHPASSSFYMCRIDRKRRRHLLIAHSVSGVVPGKLGHACK
jgi:hypothetical protein